MNTNTLTIIAVALIFALLFWVIYSDTQKSKLDALNKQQEFLKEMAKNRATAGNSQSSGGGFNFGDIFGAIGGLFGKRNRNDGSFSGGEAYNFNTDQEIEDSYFDSSSGEDDFWDLGGMDDNMIA